MILNIALWQDPDLFGDFGADRPRVHEPDRSTRSSSRSATRSPGCRPGRSSRRSCIILIVGRDLLPVAVRGRATRHRGRPRHRRGGDRLSRSRSSDHAGGAPGFRRAASSRRGGLSRDRRRADRSAASSATSSSGAMQRVPELAGAELTLTAADRRDHEPQLPRGAAGRPDDATSSGWPATTPTCSGSAARSSTPRRSRRRASASGRRSPRSSGPRAISSPGSSRARRVSGRGGPSGRRPSAASATRSGGSTTARRSRACSSRSGSSRRIARWRRPAACRSRPNTTSPRSFARRIELAFLSNPVEMRPCHNDLLNANFIDDGTRIRIVDWEYAGMGDPFFDLGNF